MDAVHVSGDQVAWNMVAVAGAVMAGTDCSAEAKFGAQGR